MTSVQLSDAVASDIDAITGLHVESWRVTYAGMLPDRFLAGPVVENRRLLWQGRLGPGPNERQFVRKAIVDGEIVGFACVLRDVDPAWGARLDNIHVRPRFLGHGIGHALFDDAFAWAQARREGAAAPAMHLWVLEANQRARRFYLRAGGEAVEHTMREITPGIVVAETRFVWR